MASEVAMLEERIKRELGGSHEEREAWAEVLRQTHARAERLEAELERLRDVVCEEDVSLIEAALYR